MKVKTKIFIKIAVSVLVTVFMVFIAELLGEEEMIFPEVAALAVGSFLSFRMPWNVTPIRMFFTMTLSATAGYALSAFVPVPLYLKLIAAMLFSLIALSWSKTTMLPLISAAVLPVLTNVQSVIYPVSVLILTAMIIGIRVLFVKHGLADKISFDNTNSDDRNSFIRNIWIFAVFAVTAAIAVPTGITFMLAPPLAVILAEAANAQSPVHKTPVRYFLCTVLCIFFGTASRLVFYDVLGLPLTLGTLFAISGAILFQLLFRKLFPPAAALAVLPFILPQSVIALYPFQAAAGAAIFIGLDVLFAAACRKGITDRLSLNFFDFIHSIKLFRPEEMTVKVTVSKPSGESGEKAVPVRHVSLKPSQPDRNRPVRHRMISEPDTVREAKQSKPVNSGPVPDKPVTAPEAYEPLAETPVTVPEVYEPLAETPVTAPEAYESLAETPVTAPEAYEPLAETPVTAPEISELQTEYSSSDEETEERSEVAFVYNEEIQETEEKLPELDAEEFNRNTVQMNAVSEKPDGEAGEIEFHFLTEDSDIDFRDFHLSADEAVPGATAFILRKETGNENEEIPSYKLHTEESGTEITAIREQLDDDESDAATDSENNTSFILRPVEEEIPAVKKNKRERISPVSKLLPILGGRKKQEDAGVKKKQTDTPVTEHISSHDDSKPEVKVSRTGNVRRRM